MQQAQTSPGAEIAVHCCGHDAGARQVPAVHRTAPACPWRYGGWPYSWHIKATPQQVCRHSQSICLGADQQGHDGAAAVHPQACAELLRQLLKVLLPPGLLHSSSRLEVRAHLCRMRHVPKAQGRALPGPWCWSSSVPLPECPMPGRSMLAVQAPCTLLASTLCAIDSLLGQGWTRSQSVQQLVWNEFSHATLLVPCSS